MQLTDTHCHIQFGDYPLNPDEVIERAKEAGVDQLICVGCSLEDSQLAVSFVRERPNTWAAIGLHPHEANQYAGNAEALKEFEALASSDKVVAIGECGLDYYYNHSPRDQQRSILEFQLHLASKYNLPLIFHVREAPQLNHSAPESVWNDFFAILSHFEGVRGVVHSFTADRTVLDKCIGKGLYIGLNGIMTFTRDESQLDVARSVPLQNLLLETDAPFLTPKPYRGTICEPKHVREVAVFLSTLRSENLEQLARVTTNNANKLFNLQG